jgi:tRNA/rRNA methyltransferase
MEELLGNILVVLTRTKFPENIGSAARAVANMGLGGLRVAGPERLWPEPMARLASSAGAAVLEELRVFPSLNEALADCVAAVAMTARLGRRRGRLVSPRRVAPQVLELARQGRVALVFGPEDTGLSTEEVDACGYTVCIPTAQAASLNLAQAVMVMAYETRLAALEGLGGLAGQGGQGGLVGLGEAHAREDESDAAPGPPARPQPASLKELAGLKAHLQEALVAMGAIPHDNPEHFFRPFKATLERAGVTSREARAWRGLARQALWLAGELAARAPETAQTSSGKPRRKA